MNGQLTHDHSELDNVLAEFFSAIDAGDIERSAQRLDLFWARLAVHIRAEHLHLFPTVLEACTRRQQSVGLDQAPSLQSARETITRLQHDHDFFMRELAATLKQLREQRHNQPNEVREKVIAVKQRLEIHNELEESSIYRWCGALLRPLERLALNEKIQTELGDLPPRFTESGSSEEN